MRIKPGYVLRQVMDVYVIIGVGSEAYVPNEIMSVNEVGAFLWKLLENGIDKQELVNELLREYEVDSKTAEADVDAFLNQLREKALIAE